MGGILIILLIGSAIGALIKHFRTAELSSKLGRPVTDHDLVSLNSWLEAEKNAEEKRKIFKRKIVNYETDERVESASTKQKTLVNSVEANAALPEKRPENCPNCGAALSKELGYCEFCDSHVSQREIEQHCAVFLFDTQEDLISRTPILFRLLKTAAWFVPLILFAVLISANIIGKQISNPCVMLSVAAAIAFTARFALNYLAENYLTKTDNANFDFLYAPQIKSFVNRSNLQNIEFLSIARCHLEKDSRLLKQIHRRF